MKTLMTTILLCAATMMAAAQPTIAPPTLASEGLRGPVKMVMSSTLYTTESGDAAICTSETWLFDSDGRLTDYLSMSDDGQNYSTTYRYNAQGGLASASYRGGDGTREETYVYAADGGLLRIEVDYPGESKLAYLVTGTDAQKRPTTMLDTSSEGVSYSFSHDNSGRQKTVTTTMFGKQTVTYHGLYGIDSTISPNERIVYQYNEHGDLALRVWKNYNIPAEHRDTYTYDLHWIDRYGNWRWRKITFHDGTEFSEFFEDRQIIYNE